jgi:DNA-directed RNA polymerase specialized sigma subunit
MRDQQVEAASTKLIQELKRCLTESEIAEELRDWNREVPRLPRIVLARLINLA